MTNLINISIHIWPLPPRQSSRTVSHRSLSPVAQNDCLHHGYYGHLHTQFLPPLDLHIYVASSLYNILATLALHLWSLSMNPRILRPGRFWALSVLGRPFVKRIALCYRSVVCLSWLSGLSVCLSCPVLSVTLVYCGQTVGWIKMKLGMQIGLGPGHIVLDEDPAPLHKGAQLPIFGPCLLWPFGWMDQGAT